MTTDVLLTWDAPSGRDGLRDLMNYIQERDAAFNGRIRLQESMASADAMGPTTDQLIIEGVTGLSGQLVGFAVAWLHLKRSKLSLTIQNGDQKIEVTANTKNTEIINTILASLRQTQAAAPAVPALESGDTTGD